MSWTASLCAQKAIRIWILLGATWVLSVLIGAARGPANYAWLFAMGCWMLLDIYWGIAASTNKISAPVRTSCGTELVMILIYAAYCLPLDSVPVLSQRIMPRLMTLEVFGAFLCAFGIGLAIWARHHLAESWNADVALNDRHHLVQNGPYAIVRHPIYLGFLTAVTGMVLVLGEVRALVLLFGVNVLLSKMSDEEAGLRSKFPTEYLQYEQRVKKLIPWIW